MKILSLGLITLCLSGCADKRPVGVNVIIPLACLTQPIELLGCDLRVNPPTCKKSKVVYRKSCMEIEAK